MAYRFGIGSLPSPRFVGSTTSGYGIFFTVPLSSDKVDAAREKIALAQDLDRKKRRRPMLWYQATGELARLLSLTRS